MDTPVEKEVVETKQEVSEKETFQEKYVEKVNTEEKLTLRFRCSELPRVLRLVTPTLDDAPITIRDGQLTIAGTDASKIVACVVSSPIEIVDGNIEELTNVAIPEHTAQRIASASTVYEVRIEGARMFVSLSKKGMSMRIRGALIDVQSQDYLKSLLDSDKWTEIANIDVPTLKRLVMEMKQAKVGHIVFYVKNGGLWALGITTEDVTAVYLTRANIGVEDGVVGAYHVDMLTPIVKGISKVFPKQEVAIYKMNENTQAPMRISAGEEGLQADFFIAPRILTDDEIKECEELIEVFA